MNNDEVNPPAPRFASAGREYIFHVLLTIGLFLSISFIPLAGFFTGMLTPLPTTLALIRLGLPGAWLVPGISALAGGAVLLRLGMANSIPYFFALLCMGAVLGYGTKKLWTSEKVIGLATLAVTVISALLLALSFLEAGEELIRLLEQDLQGAISTAMAQLGTSSADMKELGDSLAALVPMMVRIMPGISMACTLGIAWLNMLVARRFCRTAGLGTFVRDDWTHWKSPEPLVWVLIAGGVAVLLPLDDLKYPALNVLVVLGSIYFLQGLAIAAFYFEKWKLPTIFRGLAYGILLVQQVASMGIAIAGLFDMWFDFRRITKKPA